MNPNSLRKDRKHMYKIITCDLDETLLCMDRSVCKRNIDAIHAAKEKGVKFI